MLKKLFSRKKTPVTKISTAPRASEPPESHTLTLAEWVSALGDAEGKARVQKLNGLLAAINDEQFSFAEVRSAVDKTAALMLTIQLDREPVERADAALWAELVKQGFTAKVRKYAAAQISDYQQLKSLVKATKGKDKAVFRILQDALDQQDAQQKGAAVRQQKIDSVLQAAKRLAAAPYEPMYEARLKGLQEQWRELAVNDSTAAELFNQSLQTGEEKIAQVKQEEAAKKAVAESMKMADANRQSLIEQLTAQVRLRLAAGDVSEDDLQQDQRLLVDVQQQWQQSEQYSKASKEENRAFQKICTVFELSLPRFRQIIVTYGSIYQIVAQLENTDMDNEALLHELDDWLHEIDFLVADDKPEPVQKLMHALEGYQQSLAEHRQQEINRVRAIRSQLRRCQSAVEEGSIRRASGLYHGVEEKLKSFDLDAHPGIRKEFDETTAALEKLRDWQSYAVLPKKEALIKKMEALIQQSIDPESRAQTIRDMQDEWKLLSRGLQNRQQDLWETFHELAQQAYEPCREFFSEQRNLREVNLARRKEVVEQLRTYGDLINWSEPDIREIDRALQAARNDWRHFSPVDRVANKGIQKEFDQVHRSIMDKLKAEQTVFHDNKLAIIEQAKKLLELEDARAATEQAKELQKAWKNAGIVSRKNEQELWKAFREVCDKLFARREQQIQAFKADLDSHKVSAENIIQRLEDLAKSDDLLNARPIFEQLKAEFDQLGTLPKAHYARLTKHYKEACEGFEKAVTEARQQAADQHWQRLIDWVQQARFSEQSEVQLTATWSEMTIPSTAQALIERLSLWRQSATEENQAVLHEKTIDLEILLGVQSPVEDSAMRMNLQVQRLSEGIGTQLTSKDVDRLVVEWLSVGAVEASVYAVFEVRMKLARAEYLKQKAK